jgi:hypothetical protein
VYRFATQLLFMHPLILRLGVLFKHRSTLRGSRNLHFWRGAPFFNFISPKVKWVEQNNHMLRRDEGGD